MSRTVIITGGTKGLGRELALASARHGDDVVAIYRSDAVAAEETEKALRAVGPSHRCLCWDITSGPIPFDWPNPVRPVVLINNAAASFRPKPAHLWDWSEVAQQLEVAVHGSFNCVMGVVRAMVRDRQGTIVNVLSRVVAESPPKGFLGYVAAKGALEGFTRALAAEFTARGLRIFAVSPGFMDTPLTAGWDDLTRQGARAGATSSGAEETARRIMSLVDDPELATLGQTIPV